jgi:hypothetical protein
MIRNMITIRKKGKLGCQSLGILRKGGNMTLSEEAEEGGEG